jgi:hypothetical protein
MPRLLLFAACFALVAGGADAATQCKDPKTGKFIACPATGAAAPASAGSHPHCSTGVPCGNSCIAKGKTCHKT